MTQPGFGRYPADALKADGLRSGLGLAVTLGPLALVGFDAHPLVAVPLLAGAGLFAWLGLRTLARRNAHYELTQEGLRLRGGFFTVLVRWDQITGVRLRYYSTKRDRSGGWMQLTLITKFGKYSMESQLIGFDSIVVRISEVVIRYNISTDLATKEIFLTFGLIIRDKLEAM